MPFSGRSSQPRDRSYVTCFTGRFFTIWATRETRFTTASMGERERDRDRRRGRERGKIWREESAVTWQYHSALEAMCLFLRQARWFLLLCKVLQEPSECFFQVHCFFIASPAGGVLAAVSMPPFSPSHSLRNYPFPHPRTHTHTLPF